MAKKKSCATPWRDIKPPNTSWEPSSGVKRSRTFWKAQEEVVYGSALTDRNVSESGTSLGKSWGVKKTWRKYK
jgi:hypothetical protein